MTAISANSDSSKNAPRRRPRVGVIGATLGTGNLGVDALGMSMVQGLTEAIAEVEIVYQAWDHHSKVAIPAGEQWVECEPLVVRRKGSLRRRDGLLQLQNLAKMRKWLSSSPSSLLPTFSNVLKQLLSCDVICDVSAGDSFANIYGQDSFWYQTQIKLLCLELGLPLILMPQTYGPFYDQESTDLAASILSRAKLVCSREAEGIQEVLQLCGNSPPEKLIRVPDMAFLLEPRETALPARFLQAKSRNSPCIALNISGLLYFSRLSFGLNVDYVQLASKLLEWALSVPNSHVLLIPHVVASARLAKTKNPSPSSSDATDTSACEKLVSELGESMTARVDILPPPQDPAQAKFAMRHCDFFVGARMHAFIGAISQNVPGTLLAYSKKADGLASLLGIGDSVVDLRRGSIDACIAEVSAQYQRRQATQNHLTERVPRAQMELRRFFLEEIAPIVHEASSTLAGPHQTRDAARANSLKKKVLH